ncbi:MAG: bcp [Phycisphaerales bacterium]|nr:bcp [Phycisphaerales bacterium]
MDNAPLTIGQPAPDFDLMDETKAKVSLSSLRGKKLVLLFYPMDFSPTCTTEHCTFGPELPTLTGGSADVAVFGVSTDSPFSHAEYKSKYKIPYPLLADPTRKMVKAYGMFAGEEPFNCGKRGTVVIDPNGLVAAWQEVPMREPRDVKALQALIAGK